MRIRTIAWDEAGIDDATALVGRFNFTGRPEAPSGLPSDEIPAAARIPAACA